MNKTGWVLVIAGAAAVAVVEKRNPGTMRSVVRMIRDDWYQSGKLDQRPVIRTRTPIQP